MKKVKLETNEKPKRIKLSEEKEFKFTKVEQDATRAAIKFVKVGLQRELSYGDDLILARIGIKPESVDLAWTTECKKKVCSIINHILKDLNERV
jgi:hypothetical protein